MNRLLSYTTVVLTALFVHSAALAAGNIELNLSENPDLVNTPESQLSAHTLGIYFVSPFKMREKEGKDGAKFLQLAEQFIPIDLEGSFGKTALANPGGALIDVVDDYYNKLIDVTSLCTGEGDEESGLVDPPAHMEGEAYKRLHHCARYHPDQFSALTNIMKPYMEWRQSETSNILKLYMAKFKSERFADRLEGRLMLNCIKEIYGHKDTVLDKEGNPVKITVVNEKGEEVEEEKKVPKDISSSLLYCSNPDNWNLHTLFPITARIMCMHNDEKTEDLEGLQKYLASKPNEEGEFEKTSYFHYTVDEATGEKKYTILDQDYAAKLNKDKRSDDHKKYFQGNLYEFSLPYFIESCLLTEDLVELDKNDELPAGIKVAYGMIPYVRLVIEKTIERDAKTKEVDLTKSFATLKIETYPMSLTAEELYDALYTRAFGILSSEWFGAGMSEGWFPSPFAPKEKWVEKAAKKEKSKEDKSYIRQFSSIYLPLRLAAKIQQTGKDTAPYYWRLIAQKIAAIQSLEVLYGSTLILQEAYRVLNGVDSEFSPFLDASVKFMQTTTESYKNSLDLAQASTLEDILVSIEKYISTYNTASGQAISNAQEYFGNLNQRVNKSKK